MTRHGADHYKKILEMEYWHLLGRVRRRDLIEVDRLPDVIDDMQSFMQREISITELDHNTHLLQQVEAALLRIEEGEFGTCLSCDNPINPARLEALPWAPLCILCQEIEDRERTSYRQYSMQGFESPV